MTKHSIENGGINKPKYYTIAKGTPLYSGPLGRTHQFQEFSESTYIAIQLDKKTDNGITSFFVQVISPIEFAGTRGWIAKTPGVKGFRR